MNQDDLLDNLSHTKDNTSFIEIIRWWEKKRIIYNLIIIPVEIIMTFLIWNGFLRWGLFYVIFGSILFSIIANVFYTIGWGLELLGIYYFKDLKINNNARMLLFTIGTLFSVLVTFITYYIWLDVNEI